MYVWVLPGIGHLRLMEQWAADCDHEVDRVTALEGTYTWARSVAVRMMVANGVCMALVLVLVGSIAGGGRVAARAGRGRWGHLCGCRRAGLCAILLRSGAAAP